MKLEKSNELGSHGDSEINSILKILHPIGQQKNYKGGDFIFHAGSPGSVMFFIEKGAVEIRINEQLLEVLERGAVFGEMAVIDDRPRSADAITITDCCLIEVDRAAFFEMMGSRPALVIHILRLLSERLRRMNELVLLSTETKTGW